MTSNRVFLLAAEDEDSQLQWLDWLGDTLEMRSMSVQKEAIQQHRASIRYGSGVRGARSRG